MANPQPLTNVERSWDQIFKKISDLAANGNTKKAKEIVMRLLMQKPVDLEARGRLREIARTEQFKNPGAFVQKLKMIYQGQEKDLFRAAAKGWCYTWVIDGDYLLPETNIKKPKAKKKEVGRSGPLPVSHSSAADYITQIRKIHNIKERWDFVQDLVQTENDVLLGDSFLDVDNKYLKEALAAGLKGKNLNIVIFGAGCVGLTLANALKMALGDKINILVVENRIQEQHIKKPYNRDWLTNIRLSLMESMITQDVADIFRGFGCRNKKDRRMIGVPLHMMETFLLLSNKALGVKFLFTESEDYSFLENTDTHLVFDATGGRLNTACLHKQVSKEECGDLSFGIPNLKGFESCCKDFGVKRDVEKTALNGTLKKKDGIYYPYIDGRLIQNALIKITHVPLNLHDALLDHVRGCNKDCMTYVWNGTLCEDINQTMLLFSLTKDSYQDLLSFQAEKTSFADFLKRGGLDLKSLDPRIPEIMDIVIESGADLADVMVEPPFLFAPRIRLLSSGWNTLHGRLVFPLGDSIYNGSPKFGNGLAYHLHYIRMLNDVILNLYGR